MQSKTQPSEAHVHEPMQAIESEDTEMVSELNSDGKGIGNKRSWVWDHFTPYDDKKKMSKERMRPQGRW